jgi:hypothetical protein
MPSRRDFLAAASVSLGVGVAGCSAVPAPRPKMDVGVTNWRDRALTVTVKFFDESVTEYSEALVHEERFEVPARSERGEERSNEVVREDALPDRKYLVTVREAASHHYHYRPDCSGPGFPEPGLLATFTDAGDVRFTQAACSGDEPFL